MTFNELMMEGLGLLVTGMGIVFGFLVVLVFAMKGMSRLAFALGGSPLAAVPRAPATPSPQDDVHSELTAVITAAVTRYRKGSG